MVQSSAIDTNASLPLQTMGLGSISLTPVTTPTTTPSMANIASLAGIPSPPAQQPVIIAQVSQYHPFSALGGSQLMAQETRVSFEEQIQWCSEITILKRFKVNSIHAVYWVSSSFLGTAHTVYHSPRKLRLRHH